MLDISDLTGLQKEYIKYVADNIKWEDLEFENDDECLTAFIFEATNNWKDGDFDFVNFITSYKITNIDDCISATTLCVLYKIINKYYDEQYGILMDWKDVNVCSILRNWVYVYTNMNPPILQIIEKEDNV